MLHPLAELLVGGGVACGAVETLCCTAHLHRAARCCISAAEHRNMLLVVQTRPVFTQQLPTPALSGALVPGSYSLHLPTVLLMLQRVLQRASSQNFKAQSVLKVL